MITTLRLTIVSLLMVLLAACSKNSPGPLEGKWQLTGLLPVKIEFRSGETESMGMIEPVTYEKKGDSVLVTYEAGLLKGTTLRYVVIDDNTLQTELGTLKRID